MLEITVYILYAIIFYLIVYLAFLPITWDKKKKRRKNDVWSTTKKTNDCRS